MPPRTAARSASRKNTPQSPPKGVNIVLSAPAPVRRGTRSQSRELNEDHVREQSNYQARNALSTVNEEQDVIDPELRRVDQDRVGDDNQGPDDDYSPNHSSDEVSLSESAHTSFSRAGFLTLDREVMLDSLPDLLNDSDSLLAVFLNSRTQLERLRTDIASKQSRVWKRLSGLVNAFAATQDAFGTNPAGFIEIQRCSRKLLNRPYGEGVSDSLNQAEAVLYLANIAHLISMAFTLTLDSQAAYNLLMALWHQFPSLFDPQPDLPPGESHSSARTGSLTIELGLELGTHFFIGTVKDASRQQGRHPEEVLGSAFYNEDGSYRMLGTDDGSVLPKKYHKMFQTRVEEVRKHFRVQDTSVDSDAIENVFPWATLLDKLVHWGDLRAKEIHAQIDNLGGMDAIQDRLQRLPDQSQESQDDEMQSEQHLDPEPIHAPQDDLAQNNINHTQPQQQKKKTKAGFRLEIQKTKKLAAATQKQKAAAATEVAAEQQPEASQPETPQSPIAARAAIGGQKASATQKRKTTEDLLLPTQLTAIVLQVEREHELQSNKENLGQRDKGKGKASYIDRQPDAEQLQWVDSQVVAGPSTVPTRSPAKRKRMTEVDNDDDEEDEFETDTRPLIPGRARTDRLHDNGDALDNYQVDDDDEVAARNNVPRRRQPQSQPHRHSSTRRQTLPERPISSAPTNHPPPSSMGTQRRFTQPQKPPQQRVPWSSAETKRLIELIEEHSNGWAYILDIDKKYPQDRGGPQLQARGQVQCKDKARNLKVDFIKSGIPLPRNFDRVALGSRMIEKLEQDGYIVS